MSQERTCSGCEGRGRVWVADVDFDDEGDYMDCPDCDGYRVELLCERCGEWGAPPAVNGIGLASCCPRPTDPS